MASWVVVNNETGKPAFETFNQSTAGKIRKYSKTHRVVPILEWLQSLNAQQPTNGES